MPRRTAAGLLAALTLTLAAGCGARADEAADPPAPAATGEPWYDEIAAAEADGEVGRTGTPCPLPVAFPLAKGWRAEAVELPAPGSSEDAGADADPNLGAEVAAALAHRGGATVRCEVDGRRQGGGFLRVWTTARADAAPRAALEAFLADTSVEKAVESQFRETAVGAFTGVEATWVSRNELLDEENRGWATAVHADGQTLLLTVSEGLIAEGTDVLPAYRLATGGLTAVG